MFSHTLLRLRLLAILLTVLAGPLAGCEDNESTAEKVGEAIAQALIGKGIKQVVFDRNGYIYHGRVKALADGARKGGLEF